MIQHINDSLLQDFREDLLDQEAMEEVREHLDACAQCREELKVLSDILDGLVDLPAEAQPSRDLWPQIAWRMEGVTSRDSAPGNVIESEVAEYPETRSSWRGRGRRVNLPAWQFLAASIALMVISGSAVWAFLSGRMDGGGPLDPVLQSPAQLVGLEEAYGGYDEAVADLESVLERGRESLDPETVRVLEESLRAIDRAIQEAEDALTKDPGSTLLQRFMADNLRKKMDLLRRAAGAVYATA